ncbi:fimbrial protein [Pantoea ananatis]|nr:fimbrial protein [Pantoea ananatis]QKV90229.1 fimbrial protein [Pantoea ananatis]
MKITNVLCILSLFLLSAAFSHVYAYTCNTLTNSSTLTPPSLLIQRDLPVGSPVGNEIVSNSINAFTCSNSPSPSLTYQEFGVKGYGNYVTTINGRRIYSTNIAGIGYAVGITSVNNCFVTAYVDGTQNGDGNVNNKLICYGSGLYNSQPVTALARIQFYKTSSVTGSGIVNGTQAGSFILRNDRNSWWLPESYINTSAFTVTTVACSVNNSAITVDMGKVEKRAFNGNGSWPGDENTRSFSIPLNCNPGTKVNVQIDGNTQNASQGILNLSQSTGNASGVGVQILYKDTPLKLSSEINTGTSSSGGLYNIPLKARYYQTGGSVLPGNANASATFTLTYR